MSEDRVNIRIFSDSADLTQATAEHITGLAAASIDQHGRFSLVLSGGSTPRGLYALLASETFADRIDWPRVFVFWGDERCVPPDDADSNYLMARETLLDHVPLPPENIHRIAGEIDPQSAAEAYEHRLRDFFAPTHTRPRFDLVLLGMGGDGHTASLFPGTAALDETTRWVVANFVPRLDTWRITLTLPALNSAANVLFLVTGSDKSDRLAEVLEPAASATAYPAQRIRPDDGQVQWMVDRAAAARLKNHGR